MSPETTLKHILGQTIIKCEGAESNSKEIVFELDNGKRFQMYHDQDCCECVSIESVKGKIDNILNSPVISALESVSNTNPLISKVKPSDDSFTWTQFKIKTAKGTVRIRWLGESNGYYGEGVNFCEIK